MIKNARLKRAVEQIEKVKTELPQGVRWGERTYLKAMNNAISTIVLPELRTYSNEDIKTMPKYDLNVAIEYIKRFYRGYNNGTGLQYNNFEGNEEKSNYRFIAENKSRRKGKKGH